MEVIALAHYTLRDVDEGECVIGVGVGRGSKMIGGLKTIKE